MRSVMEHSFSVVPEANIPRSVFNRSCSHKTTMAADLLIPIFLDEIYPADTINMDATIFVRTATLEKPIMDNMFIDTFWFFVPNRLVWDDSASSWQRFMGERTPDPDSSIDFTVPVIDLGAGGATAHSLADYFGIQIGVANQEVVALPFRGYNLIFNEWFRSQDLTDSVTVDKDAGPDAITDYVPLKRCKKRDYFTSCLPSPQVGDAIDIPLGTEAPVLGIGKASTTYDAGATAVYESGGNTDTYNPSALIDNSGNYIFAVERDASDTDHPYIRADLTNATAATINSLRLAFSLQKMVERDQRSGTRYVEMVEAHFGTKSPDLRATRPIFLGGSTQRFHVAPVPQTSETSTTLQGNLAAYSLAVLDNDRITYSFTEHGYLFCLANIRGDQTYQQGTPRFLDPNSRSTREDFYFPAMAHIGEQAVLVGEIYTDGTNDDTVFGYNEAWADLRYKPSMITGVFRSGHANTLDVWHLSEQFGSEPSLNDTFIRANMPIDRVSSVSSPANDSFFYVDAHFRYKHVRALPVFSVPGLIDHF